MRKRPGILCCYAQNYYNGIEIMISKLSNENSKKAMGKNQSKSIRVISKNQVVISTKTLAKKYEPTKYSAPLDRLRTISMGNIDKPTPIKPIRSIHYRKKNKSIFHKKQQPPLSALPSKQFIKFSRIRNQSVKTNSESTRVGDNGTLPKIEQKNPKQISRKYLLDRPKTVGSRYNDNERRVSRDHIISDHQEKRVISSDHQAPSTPTMPQHKRKICQCKIIKCSKVPFPLTGQKSKRQRKASNLEEVLAEMDKISVIKPNLSTQQNFFSPESQFYINF